MRRYIPLLLCGLCILFVVLATLLYTMSRAGQKDQSSRFVPVTKTLTVYTTMPAEMASIIANEYREETSVQINFIPVDRAEMRRHIESGDFNNADMVLSDSPFLMQMAEAGELAGSISEQEDIVGSEFKAEDNKWIGIWYDPVVFCYNEDYVKNNWYIPLSWQELSEQQNIRISMTDFMAASAAANILYSMNAAFGTEQTLAIMKDIHPKVVRYAKYLSTPMRMAGMSEADVAVGVQSEALKYIHDNYPLAVVYPRDGTAYQLTSAGILSDSRQKEEANSFIQWLLGDEVHRALQNSQYYYVPTNYSSLTYKEFAGKNIKFFAPSGLPDAAAEKALLDAWVKQVRLTD